MTVWYRAHNKDNAESVFSGEGGLFVSGRWHHLGNKVIYCSASIALCELEWLAHHGCSVSSFSNFRYSIEVPDQYVLTLSKNKLPSHWDATPATDYTRDFSEKILFKSSDYLAIAVPSVLVPEELNLVINPLHKEFSNVRKSIKELGKHQSPIR